MHNYAQGRSLEPNIFTFLNVLGRISCAMFVYLFFSYQLLSIHTFLDSNCFLGTGIYSYSNVLANLALQDEGFRGLWNTERSITGYSAVLSKFSWETQHSLHSYASLTLWVCTCVRPLRLDFVPKLQIIETVGMKASPSCFIRIGKHFHWD